MRRMIFIAVLAALSLALLNGLAWAEEAIAPEENAATYYNKAFELMKPWPSKDARNRARKIIKEGWKEEDKELEQLLKANRPAFEEFRKGVAKQKCRFVLEEWTISSIPVSHFSKVRKLARRLIIEARLFERNGELDRAMQNCVDVIKLGHDCAQDKYTIARLVDIAVFGLSKNRLEEFIHSPKLTPTLGRKTLSSLVELEKMAIPPQEVLESEKEMMKRTVKKELASWVEEAQKKMREDAEVGEYFREYYKALAGLENDEQIERAIEETHGLYDQLFDSVISDIEKGNYSHIKPFVEEFFQEQKEPPRTLPKTLCVFLSVEIHRLVSVMLRAQAQERFIIATLALRLFRMEKGRYPEKLDELVPKYLDKIPLDPFDLKPLRYKKRQGKWIIYSIGPDGEDDGGVKKYIPGEPEEGTDLIYEVE